MTGSPRLRVRIERLVIDGSPEVRASDLASALTAELGRLATTRSAPDELARLATARDASAELEIDLVADPEGGRRAIAAAVHARLAATGSEPARLAAAREALDRAPTERARLPEVTRG